MSAVLCDIALRSLRVNALRQSWHMTWNTRFHRDTEHAIEPGWALDQRSQLRRLCEKWQFELLPESAWSMTVLPETSSFDLTSDVQ